MKTLQILSVTLFIIVHCTSCIQDKSTPKNNVESSNSSQTKSDSKAVLNDSTPLIPYNVFNVLTIGIPELAMPSEKNNSLLLNKTGFAIFTSNDGKIDITIRKKEYPPLEDLKTLTDEMSIGMYNGKIIRSEIIQRNGIEIFISDISGYWNGEKEKIGMFRYYIKKGDEGYSLLMKYPYSQINSSALLKTRMIESIQLN